MVDLHKGCGGELKFVPEEPPSWNQNLYPAKEHWVCQRCQQAAYSQEDYESMKEPPPRLRWKLDPTTGKQHLTVTTEETGNDEFTF